MLQYRKRKVLEAKGTSVMCPVLKSLTDNKPSNNTHIITDNGTGCVSHRQKANTFMNMYKSVSSLDLTEEDWGVKRIVNRTLRTVEVANGACPGFTVNEVRSARRSVRAMTKFIRDSAIIWAPNAVSFLRQLFNKLWESQLFPQVWRIADIRPVRKNGKDTKR